MADAAKRRPLTLGGEGGFLAFGGWAGVEGVWGCGNAMRARHSVREALGCWDKDEEMF